VPHEQTGWVVAELRRLVDDRPIDGFVDVEVDGAGGYILAIVGGHAYLIRWSGNDLEVTFLGQLQGLHYRELSHGRGAMVQYEGEPVIRIEIRHPALSGVLLLELDDWRVSENGPLRSILREWADTHNGAAG
jgi:hypothetical protein